MTAIQIGSAGEAITAAAFQRVGVPVYLPIGDAGVDLIADFGGKPQRIQVKATGSSEPVVDFKLKHRSPDRVGWTEYPTNLIDFFALVSLEHNKVVLVSPENGRTAKRVKFTEDTPQELSAVVLQHTTKEEDKCQR